MTIEDVNRKIVEEFIASIGEPNFTDALADDATWWVAGDLPGLSGTRDKAGITELANRSMESTGKTDADRPRYTPVGFTCQGERVAVEATSYAPLSNGRVYNNRGIHFLFTVRDGKIREVKEYADTMHMYDVWIKDGPLG